jgi:photosystem II stability/assembly factor-like uncharacterized protein
MKKLLRILAGLALLSGLATPAVAAPERPAMASAKASRSLLLDVVQAGPRLVAVGEHGHIVYSDDSGQSWQQAKVPVSVLLTSVHFPSAQEGWAVGHHGVILHSADGGASWTLQRAQDEADLKDEAGASSAANFNKAGAPLLGVWFADTRRGYAVGAYGYFLATQDGGASWRDNSAAIANPDGLHLNAIRGLPGTGTVFIAGERGTLFRSQDGGLRWNALASPFDGSFFGIAPLAPDLVLITGLQGRVFASNNQGASWRPLQSGVTSGLNAATRLGDGTVVVAGNAGVLLRAQAPQLELVPMQGGERRSINALLALPGGGLLAVGEGGARLLPAGAK